MTEDFTKLGEKKEEPVPPNSIIERTIHTIHTIRVYPNVSVSFKTSQIIYETTYELVG